MTVESGDIVSKEHSDFESPEFYYCNTCKNGTHYPVVVHESQNPTCTSLGNSEKIKCSLCGAVISELEIIPALGHAWDSKPTTDKKATCTGGGLQSIHCSRCSETKDVKAIPATGHSYGEWSITKEPTCTEEGSRKKVCSACGDTVVEAVPVLDHKWNTAYTIDVPATESASGSQSIHCSVCGAIKEGSSQVIPQLTSEEIIDLPVVKILKPTAGKKKITVKWKKIESRKLKKISVIQIQYSRDRNFINGVKTVTAKKKTTSKIISKLNSKKTYYIRIRVYKKSGNEVHVSSWSAVKKVKVK